MTQNAINTGSRWIQKVFSQQSTVITGNVVIPIDTTIPQNTEGVQIMTLAITPKFSTSKLIIEFFSQSDAAVGTPSGIVALFQDTAVDALSSAFLRSPSGKTCNLRYIMTSGTTSSTTFKLRIGNTSGTIYYLNSDTIGSSLMGGVMQSSFSITEIL